MITRSQNGVKGIVQRVVVTPAFTVGPAEATEALTLGEGPDGDVWLVSGAVAPGAVDPSLTLQDVLPAGGLSPRYAFPTPLGTDDWPQALASAPDGSVWIANMTGNSIERLLPSGAIVTYALPRAGAPSSIAVAPDGSAWFTELATGAIGEVTTAGTIVERPVGEGFGGFGDSEPYAITLGADGAMWFTEQNAGRIGRVTTAGALQEFPVPNPSGLTAGSFGAPAPKDIVAGPEGALWFTDPGDESIGRITTSGTVVEYPIAASAPPSPGAIASYGGQLWFTEANLVDLGSVDPGGQPAVTAQRRDVARATARCSHRRRHRGARCSRRGHGAGDRRGPVAR